MRVAEAEARVAEAIISHWDVDRVYTENSYLVVVFEDGERAEVEVRSEGRRRELEYDVARGI